MAKSVIKSRVVPQTEPRIRRGYFECRYGQLHVHNAIPPGGGFDESTPLLALHQAPMSGAVFHKLLPLMGRDRSVYAPDLPGYGESDASPSLLSIADYASAVVDFIDTMRFRQIDVVGYQTGSFVAAEVAIARPACVRRVVCVGVPVASKADREAFRAAPWPIRPLDDGSHLVPEWERTRKAARSGLPLEELARNFADKLHSGPNAWWGLQAALDYAARDRLGQVAQPALIVRPRDECWDATLYARELMPKARLVDLPEVGGEAFQSAPERMTEVLRDFLLSR